MITKILLFAFLLLFALTAFGVMNLPVVLGIVAVVAGLAVLIDG